MLGDITYLSSLVGQLDLNGIAQRVFSQVDVDLLIFFVPKIALALCLGLLLGLERRHRGKQAGVRTHMVLAVAACLVTVCGHHLYNITEMGDPARLAHGVISGVGFVGAGVILRRGMNASGITTSVTILFAVTIGIACGLGLYLVPAIVVVLTLTALTLSYTFFPSFDYGGNELRVVCQKDKFVEVRKLFGSTSHVDKITKTGNLVELRVHTSLSHAELEKLIATNVYNDDIVVLELIDNLAD